MSRPSPYAGEHTAATVAQLTGALLLMASLLVLIATVSRNWSRESVNEAAQLYSVGMIGMRTCAVGECEGTSWREMDAPADIWLMGYGGMVAGLVVAAWGLVAALKALTNSQEGVDGKALPMAFLGVMVLHGVFALRLWSKYDFPLGTSGPMSIGGCMLALFALWWVMQPVLSPEPPPPSSSPPAG